MAKILLVEDDSFLAMTVKDSLQRAGFLVDTAANGDAALDYLNAFEYDLLVLDRQLPGRSGIDICSNYRSKSSGPVLIMTGMSSVESKIEGFEAGADDYLTKPFDIRELLIRVSALLRRSAALPGEQFDLGNIHINTKTRKVMKDGKELLLTPREYDVLEFFARNPEMVVTTETLLKRVWHSDSEASLHAVYSCINRLRKNIDPGNKEALIKTVHGSGYRLQLDQ